MKYSTKGTTPYPVPGDLTRSATAGIAREKIVLSALVDGFASALKKRLYECADARKRNWDLEGWTPSSIRLNIKSQAARDVICPIDIAAYCAFLWNRMDENSAYATATHEQVQPDFTPINVGPVPVTYEPADCCGGNCATTPSTRIATPSPEAQALHKRIDSVCEDIAQLMEANQAQAAQLSKLYEGAKGTSRTNSYQSGQINELDAKIGKTVFTDYILGEISGQPIEAIKADVKQMFRAAIKKVAAERGFIKGPKWVRFFLLRKTDGSPLRIYRFDKDGVGKSIHCGDKVPGLCTWRLDEMKRKGVSEISRDHAIEILGSAETLEK